MRRAAPWLALLMVAACGKVEVVGDGGGGDAAADGPRSDGPAACVAPETMCGAACVDEQTDDSNCGMCGSACVTNTGCLAGDCVDSTASCAVILALDPTKPSGPYMHAADGHQFYCDMSHGPTQYEQLAIGEYSVVHTGYDFVTAADLGEPVLQQAFVWLYNHQGGLATIATWTPGNCCVKDGMTAGEYLTLGGSYLFIATAGATEAQYCGTSMTAAQYAFYLANLNVYPGDPIATTSFGTYAAAEATGCGDSANAAMYWQRHS
jgi:hypothetical protein